jgi:hypothetical protein
MSSPDGTGVYKTSAYPGKEEHCTPTSDPTVSVPDGRQSQIISTDPWPDQNVEIDPTISQSCMLSTGSTDAQQIFTHSVQPVQIRLFSVNSRLYVPFDFFIDTGRGISIHGESRG